VLKYVWVRGKAIVKAGGQKGIVTLLKEERENSMPRSLSSDGNCLAPHIHRRRPKDSMRSCRNQMALDVEDVVCGGVS
jgi:hypothetical protein